MFERRATIHIGLMNVRGTRAVVGSRGYCVLRLDLAGIGDSARPAKRHEVRPPVALEYISPHKFFSAGKTAFSK